MLKILSIFRAMVLRTFIIIGFIMIVLTSVHANEKHASLPEYIVFDRAKDISVPTVLRAVAKTLSFPLSAEDKQDIRLLIGKFDVTEDCAGIAAPQIGISKQIIIFSATEDIKLETRRADLIDTMPKTVWINPVYKGIESFGYNEDYEACFSVKDTIGSVSRYKKIAYEAYTLTGELVKGTAEGFLARVIQHEIDHLNGILFIDKVDPSRLMSFDDYHRRLEQGNRQAKLYDNTKEDL